MTIQYCSDLHLEFPENNSYIKKRPLEVTGDILIMAGDIAPLRWIENYNWFWDWISDHYKVAYWIPGNHEYYQYSIDTERQSFCDSIRKNLFLLNNYSIELDSETVIHFTTLWSKIGTKFEKLIRSGMADFHHISYRSERFTIKDYNQEHLIALDYLINAFNRHRNKSSIVVTHHVPTFSNYPEIYKDSPLNEAFAVELNYQIENWQPKYWIYGHSHYNTQPFNLANTTILTNQLGYCHMGEGVGFDSNSFLFI